MLVIEPHITFPLIQYRSHHFVLDLSAMGNGHLTTTLLGNALTVLVVAGLAAGAASVAVLTLSDQLRRTLLFVFG